MTGLDPDVRSDCAGIAWPALPGPRATPKLALLDQMLESQWWPPDTLARHQRRQFGRLLDHARRTVPYYRRRLNDYPPPPAAGVTSAALADLPILTKAAVRAAGDEIFSVAVPAGHGRIGTMSTSGSTGTPLACRTTEVAESLFSVCALREALWHGRDFRRKSVALRLPPLESDSAGRRLEDSDPRADIAFVTGPRVTLDLLRDSADLVGLLVQEAPDYLITNPSALRALLAHSRRHGLRIPGLAQVRTRGEYLPPETRAECREVWGLTVIDLYGASEVGYVAAQCPTGEHYHVQAESALVEVLDDRDRPCGPGETGRVVVTQLHNFAMPLLRYALGDHAEVGPPCRCGRGLPTLTRILGRSRGLLTLPTGEKRFATASMQVMGSLTAIRRSQLVQTALDTIEVRLLADRLLTPDEEAQLRDGFAKQLRYPFRIVLVYVDTLPVARDGKFEEFRSEIEA